MDFLPESISNYVEKYSEQESKLLQELNHETWEKILTPRMLSGHLQGRVLSMLSHMIQPTNILEIGTYTGYSALCLAEGLKENGSIDTIDINEELESFAKKYFDKAEEFEGLTLAAIFTHGPGYVHTIKPISTLADLKGKKIRIGGGTVSYTHLTLPTNREV